MTIAPMADAFLSMKELRCHFPALEETVWLDTPGSPPASLPVLRALRGALAGWESGDFSWLEWDNVADVARVEIAEWLGVAAGNIAIVDSVANAASHVAMTLTPQDRVLVLGQEFRSNLFPWLEAGRRGVEITMLISEEGQTLTDQVCRALEHRPTLLALSTCLSSTGNRPDLTRICEKARDYGVRVFLDASQSLGVIDLKIPELRPDYVAAHAYKWMLAPRGCCWLYAADESLADLRPLAPGWHCVERHHDEYFGPADGYASDAKRLDGGRSWLSWIGGTAAFRLLRQLAPSSVEHHALMLSARARAGLADLGIATVDSDLPSHIVRVLHPASAELVQHLNAQRVRCSGGPSSMRLGFHGFNDDSDVDRFLASVAEWKGQTHA